MTENKVTRTPLLDQAETDLNEVFRAIDKSLVSNLDSWDGIKHELSDGELEDLQGMTAMAKSYFEDVSKWVQDMKNAVDGVEAVPMPEPISRWY